ncbi:hypothetical protein PAEAM_14760 [Paenibacillus sp. GM1FR]|nr:hypothetical protein PAEAM_14760 [Paenibacillus sp. GM1FR]
MHAFFVRLNGTGMKASRKAYTNKETAPNVYWGCLLWLVYFNHGYVRAWLHQEEGYTEYDIYDEQE